MDFSSYLNNYKKGGIRRKKEGEEKLRRRLRFTLQESDWLETSDSDTPNDLLVDYCISEFEERSIFEKERERM